MDGKTRRTSVQSDAGFGADVLENLGQEAARVSDGRKLSGLFQLAQGPVHGPGPEALDALPPPGPVVAAPYRVRDSVHQRHQRGAEVRLFAAEMEVRYGPQL